MISKLLVTVHTFKKSGWVKLAQVFNLSTAIISVSEPIKVGNEIIITVIAQAIHMKSGRFTQATASCSTREKYVWIWENGKKHHKVQSDDEQLLHNVSSHAQTRAVNRAIASWLGVPDISSEEMSGTRQDSNKNGNVTRANNGPTDKQLGMLRYLKYVGDPPKSVKEASDLITKLKAEQEAK